MKWLHENHLDGLKSGRGSCREGWSACPSMRIIVVRMERAEAQKLDLGHPYTQADEMQQDTLGVAVGV